MHPELTPREPRLGQTPRCRRGRGARESPVPPFPGRLEQADRAHLYVRPRITKRRSDGFTLRRKDRSSARMGPTAMLSPPAPPGSCHGSAGSGLAKRKARAGVCKAKRRLHALRSRPRHRPHSGDGEQRAWPARSPGPRRFVSVF